MGKKKRKPWFKIKFGWTTKRLHETEGPEATKTSIMKKVRDRLLEPLRKVFRKKTDVLDVPLVYHVVIKREREYPLIDIQTPGTMFVHKGGAIIYSCRTLELPWKDNQRNISCIPYGEYDVKKRHTQKYGEHFHVLGVNGRSYILIHSGNFVSDIQGCILVGRNFTDLNGDSIKDVTNSKQTLYELNLLLPNNFKLIIK